MQIDFINKFSWIMSERKPGREEERRRGLGGREGKRGGKGRVMEPGTN